MRFAPVPARFFQTADKARWARSHEWFHCSLSAFAKTRESVSLDRVTYRFCFYAIKTGPWALGLSWLLNLFLTRGEPCGYTSTLEAVWVGVFGVLIVLGFVFGLRIQRRSLMLLCPFCSRHGVAAMDRSEGLKMDCPACGEIRGGGVLGWKIVRDEEEACGPRPAVPEGKMQFHSPWFWRLFGVSVMSAVCGVVIHEFGFMTVFPPLWSFFVASHLVQTFRSGCLDDNAGPTFRSRQPVKYWLRSAFWCLGYCFAVYLPIGYALQERDELKAKTEAAAKAKR